MKYIVERMDLTDAHGFPDWNQMPAPRMHCEVQGSDAQNILAGVIARDGGVQLGVTATFTDGQAVMIAKQGSVVYALRALPR
jgi:hypothetical protein